MNLKPSFAKVIITFGVLTCLLGLIMANSGSTFINTSTFNLRKGDVITGLVLFSIGLFTILVGILERKQ